MGRPEKPIPDHLPMKALACQLRQLRHDAGNPSYRQLGQLVHVQHHTLSQIANGGRVGWGRVLLYIKALQQHRPDIITNTVVATLQTLHAAGERRYQQDLERRMRRQRSAAFWDTIETASTLSARSAPAAHAPEQQGFTAGITDPEQLTFIEDIRDLHRLLFDVALRHGIDITNPDRATPQPGDFAWFDTEPAAAVAAGTPPIRQYEDMSLALVLHYIRLCGGTDGDCQAWQSTWDRLHTKTDDSSPFRQILEQLTAGDEPQPRRSSPLWPGTFLRRPAAQHR
jgi:hypothetical protein